MLAREQDRQQDPRNLVVARGASVLVARVHERLHEIVGAGSGKAARRHDATEDFGHLPPRPVPGPMRGDRKPGEKEPERVYAVLQVVVRLRETGVHLVADFLPDEAAAGDLDGELVHRVRQVDFPVLAEGIGKPPSFRRT